MSGYNPFYRKPKRSLSLAGSEIREVLFELTAIGNAVKVSAIDPDTNIEVSIVGSARMSPFSLKMNALRKLKIAVRKYNERHVR